MGNGLMSSTLAIDDFSIALTTSLVSNADDFGQNK
jgi:hypothetical protein